MKSENGELSAGVPLPVGPFVREQILSRLRDAADLARGDLEENLDRVRELVASVLERVDALALVHATGDGVGDETPVSRLRCAALSTARGEPVREFLLIPFGEVVVERPVAGESFVFTRAHAESVVRWFTQMGRKLAVDYEHQSFDRLNTRSDGLRPAAGWIGGLEVRDDGLWAVEVSWTERAAELLRTGEYRYFSPVIFWTDEEHSDVAALGPVALTNDPAMRGVQALAAGRALEGDADAARQQLTAAQAEIALLRRRLADQAADAFVERGLRLGKVLESTRGDWREDYLRDPEATEERLGRAPVLLPPGRLVALGRPGAPAPAVQRSGVLEIEREDLAAYERAAAAGRVVRVARG